ncbi:aromatic amino acid ammonia-lyase [Idiomarina sp. HP20-50]|uniref:HAL/PAL/TAL family ammonia-lyase n=1 Tax=Idiomarina sp. HP20-50 TaxID=3070813 RepID=UPI00294AD442|nr:aromatic amino acid ammonia-lyase [Idiomarina sp. HP20-50]MDV6316397.1 aromatic amino acid ammonia-lyase [Idiomarina sp. HP20-50]
MTTSIIAFGGRSLTIEDVVEIANGNARVALSDAPEFVEKVDAGVRFLDELLEQDGVIYGVTTGYGDSCTVSVPENLVNELPIHLTRFHGCGLGDIFDEQETRAILATRLSSLAQGYSGVSWELLERLVLMLNENMLPLIPKEGSVGASGDLTPLSYIAGALIGERDVRFRNKVMNSAEAFQLLDMPVHKLRPKEGLAIMNGTAVMTALACLAWDRAEYLTRLSSKITSLASIALDGNSNHFDDLLFAVKPHKGQQQVASWIQRDLNHVKHPRNSSRLQDRYSIRCAPHIIGVLKDSLPWFKDTIENELNSANDNPIIDGLGEHVLHGGHFYGGHIAMVMDSMKTAVANLADLHDRQMALLMDTKMNHGLPANLSAAEGQRKAINHGFKAVQIGCSAWTAEALKLTMPASVFSRSTECHNQDKVSMGTIAARDCIRILELTEQVVVSTLLAAYQGVELRQQTAAQPMSLASGVSEIMESVAEQFDLLTEDRPLEPELRYWLTQLRSKVWNLYQEPA